MKQNKIDDPSRDLIGEYTIIVLGLIYTVFTVVSGMLFTHPFYTMFALPLLYTATRDIVAVQVKKGNKYWYPGWICSLIVVALIYGTITLIYGSRPQKIVVMLFPLYLGWRFGIKPFVRKRRNEKQSQEDTVLPADRQE